MKQKLTLLASAFALFLVAALFFLPASSHALSITGSTELRIGSTTTYTATDSVASPFTWGFSSGSPRTATGSQVQWTAPTSIDGVSTSVVITLEDNNGQRAYMNVDVFDYIEIDDKDNLLDLLSQGDVVSIRATGGNYQDYQWSVIGPVAVAGETGTDSYSFTAPSEGTFAGQYTVTVSDGLPGVDDVGFYVLADVETTSRYMEEGGPTETLVIKGAPDGASYMISLLVEDENDPEGNPINVTDQTARYGTVTTTGVSEAGLLTFYYTPPEDASRTEPFSIVMECTNFWSDYSGYNLYNPLSLDSITIRDMIVTSGIITDSSGNPVNGATVTLHAPESYSGAYTTSTDGAFYFTVPEYQKSLFTASAPGYVSVEFTSDDLKNSRNVALQYGSGAMVSGTITKDGAPVDPTERFTASVVGYEVDGSQPVEISRTIFWGDTFRVDLAQFPGTTYAILIIYDQQEGYWGSVDISPTTFPQTGLDIDLVELSIDQDGNYTQILMPRTSGVSYSLHDSEEDYHGTIEFLPTGLNVNNIITSPLASLRGYDNPHDSAWISASPSLMFATVFDDSDRETTINMVGKSIRITMPFSLLTVSPGDFDNERIFIRSAENETLLETGYGDTIAKEDILAIDWMGEGDGRGWITFSVSHLSVFGIGFDVESASTAPEDFAWPTYDRYELFGCFVQSVGATGNQKGAAVLPLALFFAVGAFCLLRKRDK